MHLTVVLTAIIGGIFVDSLARPWSQPLANACAWSAFAWLVLRAHASRRCQLVWCLLLATAGEILLGFVWGLYEYRLGNLPLFIPPGHAVVYAGGWSLVRLAPAWLPRTLTLLTAALCLLGLSGGWDTQGPLWFLVLMACFHWGGERNFYATMFVFSFLIEAYGTTLGSWRYLPVDPWFGLKTITAPPIWTGVFYCALDVLVIRISSSSFTDRLLALAARARRSRRSWPNVASAIQRLADGECGQ